MTYFLGQGGLFSVYVDGALVPTLTLSDEQVTQIITLHLMQANLIINLTRQIADTMPPTRQLLNRHKPLRTLPHSPHR